MSLSKSAFTLGGFSVDRFRPLNRIGRSFAKSARFLVRLNSDTNVHYLAMMEDGSFFRLEKDKKYEHNELTNKIIYKALTIDHFDDLHAVLTTSGEVFYFKNGSFYELKNIKKPVDIISTGSDLVIQTEANEVMMWKPNQRSKAKKIWKSTVDIHKLAFSNDKIFVLTSKAKLILIEPNEKEVHEVSIDFGKPLDIAYTPYEKLVVLIQPNDDKRNTKLYSYQLNKGFEEINTNFQPKLVQLYSVDFAMLAIDDAQHVYIIKTVVTGGTDQMLSDLLLPGHLKYHYYLRVTNSLLTGMTSMFLYETELFKTTTPFPVLLNANLIMERLYALSSTQRAVFVNTPYQFIADFFDGPEASPHKVLSALHPKPGEQSPVISKLAAIFNQPGSNNVRLHVKPNGNGESMVIHVNREYLTYVSPHFATMLSTAWSNDSGDINNTGVDVQVFFNYVKCLYTTQIQEVPLDILPKLVDVAFSHFDTKFVNFFADGVLDNFHEYDLGDLQMMATQFKLIDLQERVKNEMDSAETV